MKKIFMFILCSLFVTLAFPFTALADVPVDAEHFPDSRFLVYVSVVADINHDGVLSEEEIGNVRRINCSGSATWLISSLKGIEYFTALEELSCSHNVLRTLDVSKNTALKTLDCFLNRLTSLDVSGCSALTSLVCSGNSLTTLDVRGCTALKSLSCDRNILRELDVSKNLALTYLNCYNSGLTTLDVSKNLALTNLSCQHNYLTELDLSKNTALEYLLCNNNELTTLDIGQNTALISMKCSYNKLTTLDTSKNTALQELECDHNRLPVLDLTKNTELLAGYNLFFSQDISGLKVKQNGGLYQVDLTSCVPADKLPRIIGTPTGKDAGGKKSISPVSYNNGVVTFDVFPGKVTYIYNTGFASNKVKEKMDVTLTADTPPFIQTDSLKDGIAKESYSDTLSAWGTAPVTWSVTQNKLPDGLTLNENKITGTPETAGTFSFTVTASNDFGVDSKKFSITIQEARYRPGIVNSLPDAVSGVPYDETILVTGTEPVTWSITSGRLPDGLSIIGNKITGTPEVPRDLMFYFTVKASNVKGSVSQALSLFVWKDTWKPVIKTATLPDGTVGAQYSLTLTAAGEKPITWSATGLPSGLTLNKTSGKLSGTPKQAGTFNLIITATNYAGSTNKNCTLTIRGKAATSPAIKTTTLKNGTVGTSYSATLSATGSSVKWSRTAGTLPSGLSLSSVGKITGKPKKAGTYKFTVMAKNNSGSTTKDLTIIVQDVKPKIKTTSLAKGTVGKAYSATLKVSAGTGITWSVGGGKLPDGVTLNSSTGKLSGRPAKAGKFSVTFKATNSGGSASKKIAITIKDVKPKITITKLPGGTMGTPYSVTLQATGTNVTWTKSGTLPAGLRLSKDGVISGTPTKAKTYSFTVKAKNSGGTASKKLKIVIAKSKSKAGTADLMDYETSENLTEGPGNVFDAPENSGSQYDTITPDDEDDVDLVSDENLDCAGLNVLSGDDVLDGDLVEVEPEQAVSFVIGPWTDANGDSVTVTNLKVYAADELTGIEAGEDGFTLPGEMFSEGDEFSVYVTAEAGGQVLKSKEVYLIVRDGTSNFPAETSQTEASRNENRSGCDTGLAGICALALLALLKRR